MILPTLDQYKKVNSYRYVFANSKGIKREGIGSGFFFFTDIYEALYKGGKYRRQIPI